MKYYLVSYPNYTGIVLKSTRSIEVVLDVLLRSQGLVSYGGTIYNPKVFQTLTPLTAPSNTQKLSARTLEQALIGQRGRDY